MCTIIVATLCRPVAYEVMPVLNSLSIMKIFIIACLLALALPPVLRAAEKDVVLADFEGEDYGAWKVEGEAFGKGPAHGALGHQKPVTGFLGRGLANSYNGGDKSKGRLTSPEFKMERRYLSFLIGGGGWEGKTCINLLVDGKVVRTAAGTNVRPGGVETLSLSFWDVADLAGKSARIEIVDDASSSWGHINVDQIVLTDVKPRAGSIVVAEEEEDKGDGELLYNGIRLPKHWPPRITDPKNRAVRPVPWLEHPPEVISVDVGRQLFVDDFLIGSSANLTRSYHHPKRYEGNPVLKPETEMEMNQGEHPVAALFNDGVCFDPKDHLFKMWYHAGWFDGTGYATSKDGLHWQRADQDVMPGTNRILPAAGHGHRDGSAVWLDHSATDPAQRFKMFLYERPSETYGGQVFASPDGIHWGAPTRTGMVGDNTTIFYNPFRKKWVYSVRTSMDGRTRSYRECDDLFAGAQWHDKELVFWAGADELDLPDPKVGDRTQLYNLDAVGYESLMLGVFNILFGPTNEVCAHEKHPKLTDLELAFSRDGFHWHRPEHVPFLAGTRKEGDWDRAYLHPAATICAIVGDKLYFYYSGFSGISPKRGGDIYAGASTGVAILRRDGFASMDAGEKAGTLTTRTLTFGGSHLFVNASVDGELKAEVLDENGKAIAPFTLGNCVPFSGDKTKQHLAWKDGENLKALAGKKVKLRFQLARGQLYAFWVSPDESGASHGFVAAGGPEFNGPVDAP